MKSIENLSQSDEERKRTRKVTGRAEQFLRRAAAVSVVVHLLLVLLSLFCRRVSRRNKVGFCHPATGSPSSQAAASAAVAGYCFRR